MLKKILFFIFALLSIVVGFYPIIYFLIDPNFGLLGTKAKALFDNKIWHTAFYVHILLGGLSLLLGWSQFSAALRKRYIRLHRTLGKCYVLAVLLSGIAALYIAYYATGGIVTKLGFGTLAVLWLYGTIKAFQTIRRGAVTAHQYWMIYSFALTWAAVTLRIWLPILVTAFRGDFVPAYRIVAWLSWVPNLVFAYFFTKKLSKN